MTHKVDNRVLRKYLEPLGRKLCLDMRPHTIVSPFRMAPGNKLLFPERTSFVFDPAASQIYCLPTSEYTRMKEEFEAQVKESWLKMKKVENG